MGMRDGNRPAPATALAAVLRRVRELDSQTPDSAPFSEALLRSLLQNAPDIIATITVDGRIMFLNRDAPGFSTPDLVGTSVFTFLLPESHAAARACFERVVRTHATAGYHSTNLDQDGGPVHYHTRVGPIVHEGEVIALTLIATDVSDQRQTVQTLRETEESLGLIAQRAGIGVWSWDMVTGAWEADETIATMLGAPARQVPTRYEQFLDLVHPADRASVETSVARSLHTGRGPELEFRVIRPDGEERWISHVTAGVRDEAGALVKVVGGSTDVTERIRHEEQQRQQQKLSAIGQLCAGIAHNFNNQLTGVLANLELANRRADAEMSPLLTDAITAARGAADVVRQLVRFAGTQGGGIKRSDNLADLLERLANMCRRTFDGGVSIELDIDGDLPTLRMNATEIEQALLNLLINARDARAPGREDACIRISVDVCEPSSQSLYDSDQTRVRIRVSDNGVGMSPEVQRRVFEPFFTTKDVGKGTGLGLATTYAIVSDHGGNIHCESAPSAGTTFTVLLPTGTATSGDIFTPELAQLAPHGTETILIVDDEDVVRRAIQRVLAGVGYEVLPASSATEATTLLGARRGDVALVIVDVSTIAGSGHTLLARMRTIDRRVSIMALSGYGASAMDELDVCATQTKPLDFDRFLRTVRELLDARAERAPLSRTHV